MNFWNDNSLDEPSIFKAILAASMLLDKDPDVEMYCSIIWFIETNLVRSLDKRSIRKSLVTVDNVLALWINDAWSFSSYANWDQKAESSLNILLKTV